MNQNNYSSSTPTPAMLATFQHQKSTIFGPQSNTGNINPAQLINGIGPASINPAALTAAASSPFPQQQQQQHINAMLQVVGITRDQFQNMSHQERQSVGAKYMSIMNAHQHQQHQQHQQMAMMNAMNNNNNAFSNQQQNFYDRPSSSASSHSQQPSSSQQQQPSAMMPPPPPRPPTAQGGHHSRPGTSHAHRSPTIPGGPQGQMLEMMQMKEMMQQGQQRSQSRMAHRNDHMMNGFNPPIGIKPPQQQHQQGLFTNHQQSQPQSQTSSNQYPNQPPSSPPAMDSPYRGSTRKMAGDMASAPAMKMPMGMGGPASPRMGGALGLTGTGPANVAGLGLGPGIMGPPGLPRSVSGDPMNIGNSSNTMMNGQQRQSPRPQSSMDMNPDISSRLGIPPSGPQQQPQRHGSIPPQFSNPQQQQQMRQGSLPPGTGPGQQHPQQQQQRQKMGQDGLNMNIGGGSMGMNIGGSMGMGMKTNNDMRASMPPTSTTPMNNMMGIGGMNPMSNMGGMNPNMGVMNMNPMNMNIPPAPHSTSSASSIPHTPASPIVPQGMGPSLSVSSIGSVTMPSIQQTPSIGPISSASNSGPTTVGAAPSTPLATATVSTSATTVVGTPANASVSTLPPLKSSTTQITTIPLATAHLHIPALTSPEITQIQGWMKKDQEHETLLGKCKESMIEEVRDALGTGTGTSSTGGIKGMAGPGWWEAPGTGNFNRWRRRGEMFEVRYPRTKREREREREREGRGKKIIRREGLKLPRVLDVEDANRPEQLVPLRIEFDVEHHKMRDTFVWNLNDPIVTPEAFAQSIVEDYTLAPSYHNIIVKIIQDQLSDFKAHSANYDGENGELLLSPSSTSEPLDNSISKNINNDIQEESGPMTGILDDDDLAWWRTWRKRNQIAAAAAVKGNASSSCRRAGSKQQQRRKKRKIVVDPDEDGDSHMFGDNEQEDDGKDKGKKQADFMDEDFKPMALSEIKIDEQATHEDIRILIKLDIIVGSVKLDDQFEWDLDNATASPEEFAEVYTKELGLGGEFKTAISHSIREQVQTYQKSLFLVGHPSDGSFVQDEDLKLSFLPSLTSGARPVSEVQMFTPLLNYLSDGELERTEKERDKDLNKRRKRNTRGRRGIALPDREPIRTYRTPAIGFPELDAATLALAAAASAPMSRRAAAAAASVTIANMVASENGTAFMPQMIPTAPQPPPTTTSKEKKPKGLFKPPAYPSSILRPRAQVAAPTPSTALDSSNAEVSMDNEAPPSSSSVAPISSFPFDNRNSKLLTARRAKELEREAKEKEFVDGQHPNFIDGVWHCSNCGCPDSIAIGRRKGPLGDKSQCGTCGKFWHRHRRPRPVTYNPDPDFHSGVKQKETEGTKTPAKRKGAAAALRAQSAAASAATPADISEPQTPSRSNGGDIGEPSSRKSPTPPINSKDEDDRGMSPVSTASSASEAPLAHRVKMNGNHTTKRPATPAPAPVTPVKQSEPPTSNPAAPPPSGVATAPSAQPGSPSKTWPPPWLSGAMQAMRAKYPTDKFEVTLRKVNATSTPEWRIKCQDCPGKLYTPGPGETLSNYEVHLKNRLHRQRVNERLGNIPPPSS